MSFFREGFRRFAAACLLLVVAGAGCTGAPDAAATQAAKKTTLVVWGVVDDQDAYQSIFNDFRQIYPFVQIEYRRFRLEEYEAEMLNALAEDRGPDIFLIHNTWVGKYQPKLLPQPPTVKVAAQKVVGTLKKEVTYELQSQRTVTPFQFREDYPDAVGQDFVRSVDVSTVSGKRDIQPRVFGVPMSVDTLAMYVNKDLLNTAGVSTVPQDWLSFQNAVKRLTRQTPQGEIQQAGAAIGTGLNVERSPDILALLMMQNGADMSAEDGSPTFNVLPTRLEGILEEPPAYQAVRFYTDFGNPGKEVYTWNNQQPNSLDAFVQGKAAFFFGYAYHMPIIKARGPKINLGISKVPQIEGNPVVNFANYWAWGVSKKTKNPDLSWALLNFMRKPEENTKFLAIAKRPAALKSQIDAQLEDPDVNVFAAQVLTAKSWYRGNNARTADDALVSLIEAALVTDQEQLPQLVNLAVQKVAQTIGYNGF